MGRVKNKILGLALRVGLGLASIGGASLSGCARSVNYPPIFGVSPADSEMIKYVETRGGDINKDGLEDVVIGWEVDANNKKVGIKKIIIPFYRPVNWENNFFFDVGSIILDYEHDKTHFNIYSDIFGSEKDYALVSQFYPLITYLVNPYIWSHYKENFKTVYIGHRGVDIIEGGRLRMKIMLYDVRGFEEWGKLGLKNKLRIEEYDGKRKLTRITIIDTKKGEVVYSMRWNPKKSRYEISKDKLNLELLEFFEKWKKEKERMVIRIERG